MNDVTNFLGNLGNLSSGTPATEDSPATETLFSVLFDLLGQAGSWADAVSKILGLVG